MVEEVNDSNFDEEVIEKSKSTPVLVDFFAEWCPPCKMLSPILEKLANEYKDKIKIVRVNVDKSPIKAQEYSISAIPSVKLFKNGKVISEFLGFKTEEEIKEFININLKDE